MAMTRFERKQDIDRRVAEAMRGDGFEARSTWTGGTGEIHCGNPGLDTWNFTVHVDLVTSFDAKVEIKSLYDVMRRGRLVDVVTEEPVPERSFTLPPGDDAAMDHFVRELRKETKRWADRIKDSREAKMRGDIEEPLRVLIERDPDAAPGIIAAILNERLAAYEVEEMRQAVEAAGMGLPAP